MSVSGDEVLVTDYSGITVLDRSLETVARIENRLFAGLHEIACVDDEWWVVSTLADSVLRVDRSGDVTEMWRPAESKVLAAMLGLPETTPLHEIDSDPRTMAGRLHNLSHMNSLSSHGTDLLVSLGLVIVDPSCHESGALPGPDRADSWIAPPGHWGAAHVIVRLPVGQGRARPVEPDVMWSGPANVVPNHDVVLRGDSLWFSDTPAGQVRRVVGGHVHDSVDLDTSFARGLVDLGDGRLLAGANHPQRLALLDAEDATILSTHAMPTLADESITSMCVVTGPAVGDSS